MRTGKLFLLCLAAALWVAAATAHGESKTRVAAKEQPKAQPDGEYVDVVIGKSGSLWVGEWVGSRRGGKLIFRFSQDGTGTIQAENVLSFGDQPQPLRDVKVKGSKFSFAARGQDGDWVEGTLTVSKKPKRDDQYIYSMEGPALHKRRFVDFSLTKIE